MHQHRPVAYLHQHTAIPDLPEVPASTAEPTEPDHTPSTAAPASATVQNVLRETDLPMDQQRWLIEQLGRLADEPHLQMVARANDYDHARPVLDEKLDELFAEAVDATDIDGVALATRYFDDDGRAFRHAFREAASTELYHQARTAAEPVAPAEPATSENPPDEPTPQDDSANTRDEDEHRPDSPVAETARATALPETQRRRRGHPFYPPADILATVPPLYGTEGQPADAKTLHLHYFGGAHDIWLAEYDPATGEGFGYISIGDPDGAEWGYVSLPELEQLNHGLVIIERDLYWTPTPASQANLPGWQASRPAPEPSPPSTPAATAQHASPTAAIVQQTDRDAATATPQPTTTPSRQQTTTTPEPPDLTPSQRAAMRELGKDRGEPWSIQQEWRIRTFAQLSTEDHARLPADDRQALTTDLQEILTSPAWRERATARRLLDRWSGSPTALTEAQDRAVDVLCVPASGRGRPDAGRLAVYGRLTVQEYLALEPGYQEDIKADLKAIADSGATKTIPRNRSGIGATVRTVADHVTGAQHLLRRLGSNLETPPFRSNATSIGQTVVGLRLNPGDQVRLSKRTVTVDRVGIDLQVHLTDGGALPDSTRRYRLIAAGPGPATDTVPAASTTTGAPGPEPTPPATEPAVSDIPGATRPVDDLTVVDGSDGQSNPEPAEDAEAGAVQLAIPLPPAAAPASPEPPATAAGRRDTALLSAEQRLLQKVAARVPDDVVLWPSTPEDHPRVLLAFVANGTYGEVSGVDLQRQPITAKGYVIEAHGLRGGYGGWHPETVIVVGLGQSPDGPIVHSVQTEMDGRLTVLDPPSPDMPAGEPAPWLRMSVEQQILAARTALGLTVEVRDGPANELWTVEGCPEQLTGEVAWWLFGGKYRSWEGRPRPVFQPKRVQEAITAGRIPAEPEQPPAPVPDRPPPPDHDVEARLARLRPYTEPGPRFHRAVAEAVTHARMKLTAGLDPSNDLLEGEVGAGLRPRSDLAGRHNGSPPASEPDRPAPPPTWLAGVTLDQEATTADGRHRVQRRINGRGTTVYVDARHPQAGMLPRGRLDLASQVDSGGPPRWQIVDHDGTVVGEHTGAYVTAEAKLLAATAALDEPFSDAETAELAASAEADPRPDAHPTPNAGTPATTRRAPAADTPAAPRDAHPVGEGDATAWEPAAVAAAAGADQPASGPPAAPSWSERIQIIDGPTLVIRGTTGAPRENGLRGLLKQYRFRYQKAGGEWRYTGRPADRAAATGDIRRWLAAQDRADAARAAKPTAALPPTEQQQRIIDAYQAGHTIAVQALAGTGKTSTLQMLAAARPQARVAYIAFNRSIADEAQRKFGRNVRADTSHAFAREALASTPLRGKLDRIGQGARWPEQWAEQLNIAVGGAQMLLPENIARMVMATVRNFRESAADMIGRQHLPGSVPTEIAGLGDAVLNYARAAWKDIADPDGKLLFDHDDYIKLWALGHPRLPCDVIFFDEAQDINPVLRKVIQDQPMQTVVGDSNQSIYGFRGAIDALKNWPAQVTLPLTQSWRFGPAVADVGNRFLHLLGSAWLLTGNPALDSSIGLVDDPDAMLARTNAGAVACVFDAFDRGKRVALMGGGRAIEDIAKAANDLQAGRGTKHPDLSRFTDWDEVRAYVEDGEDAQSLRAFVRLVDRRGADGLLQMVKELANEDQTDVDGSPDYDILVSTVHKAKGREWAQVQIADDFPQPQENQATGEVQLPDAEQLRLAYVAVTRARHRLELGSLSWIEDFTDHTDRASPVAAAATASPPLAQQQSTAAAPGVSEILEVAQTVDADAEPTSRDRPTTPPSAKSVEQDERPTSASLIAAEHETTDPTGDIRPAVQTWLSRQPLALDTPADQREWLARAVADLANDSHVRRAALAHDEQDFGRVFEPALEDRLVDASDADMNSPALLLYLRNDDFAGALNAYARHAVYHAIKDHLAPADIDPPATPGRPTPTQTDSTGNTTDHTPRTWSGPPAPRNPAQLARLDTAPGTPTARAAPAGRTSHPAAQADALRRAPGM